MEMIRNWFAFVWSFVFWLSVLEVSGEPRLRYKAITDSLPAVFSGERIDLIYKQMRLEASRAFQLRQLPSSVPAWEAHRELLRKKVIEKAAVKFFPDLPLDYSETGEVRRKGFRVKNILLQTRPGVYTTANLYVPDGTGPFPAVLTMHGHWPNGKANDIFQSIGQSLALNGYVCLVPDTWGSGERTSIHGVDEYHGSNLGASVLNLGETLLGVQLSDNIRGVDLLCSLPYVDSQRIGATGASGGGNQTMWLAAIDERVKAAMPVVSVGTFDSYVMEDNCVCEVLPEGLTFTEESGILALTAPRALQICNVQRDVNPTFVPSEMLRSYGNLAPVYRMLGAADRVRSKIFDDEHTYSPAMREHLLGWMDLFLKGMGNGGPKPEIPFEPIAKEKLMVFPEGKRDVRVEKIRAYAVWRGNQLKAQALNETARPQLKRTQLKAMLGGYPEPVLKKVYDFKMVNGWRRLAFETSEGGVIPVLFRPPATGSSDYVVMLDPKGKRNMDPSLIGRYANLGKGILIADLWGTGEASSPYADAYDASLVPFHTLSRARQWLGGSVLGQWITELDILVRYTKATDKNAHITIDGTREAGLAGLFYTVLHPGIPQVTLRQSPVSYVFDDRGNVDFFSMATQIPGFLQWGDLSLAAALSQSKVTFTDPVSISGVALSGDELKTCEQEFAKIRKKYGRPGKTDFTTRP